MDGMTTHARLLTALEDAAFEKGRKNRKRERLWCSPHCRNPAQKVLF